MKQFIVKNFLLSNTSSGFTLIEILVVFSIVTIISGVGFASFVTYSRSQQLNQTVNNVKLLISQGRFNALSVVKSNTDFQGNAYKCNSNALTGYVIAKNVGQIELSQECVGQLPGIIKVIIIPKGISYGTTSVNTICTQVRFSSLSATTSGVPCDIVFLGYNNEKKTITIDNAGNASIN